MRLRLIGVAAIMAALCSTPMSAQSLKKDKEFVEEVHAPKPEGLLEAIGGSRFLVAQLFTILGTIFGVYLASYVAFQRNLTYDRFVKAQQRSDLLMALREELKQNIDRLRKFNERLPADVGTPVLETEWPHLRQFIWQAAGRSSSALDMPQILLDVQSFYDDVDVMLNDTSTRQWFRTLTSSNVFERTRFKERLDNQLKFVEASIFSAMNDAAMASAKLLKRYADRKDAKA